MSVQYTYTNESLEAVIKGMDVKEGDDILAVLGSGDQAFAMLEHADSVVAVDIDPRQVEYARKRLGMLIKGDIHGFMQTEIAPCNILETRNAYFRADGRIKRIRQKAGRIRIAQGDIFAPAKQFSKVYLSNAFCYGHTDTNLFKLAERAAGLVKIGGLLYVAGMRFLFRSATDEEIFFESIMEREKALTEIARMHETRNSSKWVPLVYRRRA